MNLTPAISRFARQLAADRRSGHTRVAYRRDLGALRQWLAPSARREGIGRIPDVLRITPDVLARFMSLGRQSREGDRSSRIHPPGG